MDNEDRVLLAVACGLIAVVPAAFASVYLAMFLFSINAPESDRMVKAGWGFILYYSLVAGGILGGITASGLVSGNARYCTYLGAVSTIAMVAAMQSDIWTERWQGPDMFAFPLLLAVLLLGWGLNLHRSQRRDPRG